jgi:atlastin
MSAPAAPSSVPHAPPSITSDELDGPVCIISVNKTTDTLQFHPKRFRTVMQRVEPSMKVAVVSVAGAFRTGKSFLLTLLLRFLRFTEQTAAAGGGGGGARGGSADAPWLSYGGEVLEGNAAHGAAASAPRKGTRHTGFHWRAGNERQTEGIWLWSSPFVRRLPSGEDVAVLLMDTQGLWDTLTSKKLTAHIFGLSTLFSSYQVYNVKERVQEDALEQVSLFSEYARIAAGVAAGAWGGSTAEGGSSGGGGGASGGGDGGGGGEPPAAAPAPAAPTGPREVPRGATTPDGAPRGAPVFQRLELLVRDFKFDEPRHWDDPDPAIGRYFRGVFEREGRRAGEDLAALRETREHILTCFSHTSCFVLPYPGDAVAGNDDSGGGYDDSVGSIRDRFRAAVDRFARVVFCEQLEPKRVAVGGGAARELTAAEYIHFVESYADVFSASKEGLFPDAKSLLAATTEGNNRAAAERALKTFRAHIDMVTNGGAVYVAPGELELRASEARAAALKEFDGCTRFGAADAIAKARQALEGELDGELSAATARNALKAPASLSVAHLKALGAVWFALHALKFVLGLCSPWLGLCARASDFSGLGQMLIMGLFAYCYCTGTGFESDGPVAAALDAVAEAVGALAARLGVAGLQAAVASSSAAGSGGRGGGGAGGSDGIVSDVPAANPAEPTNMRKRV